MADTPSNFDPFPELPEPASRADAKEDYARKADATNAAQYKLAKRLNVFVTWLNALISWIVATRTAMTGSQDAAAKSVSDAAGQVKLAADQAGAAKGSADAAARQLSSTETVAAAVRAQINLPSLTGQKGKFWQVSDDEKTLQLVPLIVNRVGDAVVATSAPDATFIPDDTRYLQSLWPELYAKIGAVGYDVMGDNTKVNNAVTVSIGQAGNFNAIVMGLLNETVIGVTSSGQVFDLTNATSATNSSYNYPNNYALNAIATDDKGTFIACGNSGSFVKSTNNGASWTAITMPVGTANYNWQSIATDGKGGWLAFHSSGPSYPFLRSINNGVSWSSVTFTSTGLPQTDWTRPLYDAISNAWYAQARTGNNFIYKSTDAGLTWTQVGIQPPVASAVLSNVGPNSITNAKMIVRGNLIICANACTYILANSTYYGAIVTYSFDAGVTWQWISLYSPSVGTGGFPEDIVLGGDNTIVVSDFNQPYRAWVVKNFNVPKKNPSVVSLYVSNITGNYFRVVSNSFGTWYLVTNSSYKKILPLYDPKSQFYVPKFPEQPFPFSTYVKARTLV